MWRYNQYQQRFMCVSMMQRDQLYNHTRNGWNTIEGWRYETRNSVIVYRNNKEVNDMRTIVSNQQRWDNVCKNTGLLDSVARSSGLFCTSPVSATSSWGSSTSQDIFPHGNDTYSDFSAIVEAPCILVFGRFPDTATPKLCKRLRLAVASSWTSAACLVEPEATDSFE